MILSDCEVGFEVVLVSSHLIIVFAAKANPTFS